MGRCESEDGYALIGVGPPIGLIKTKCLEVARTMREAAKDIRADSMAEYEAHWSWLDDQADVLEGLWRGPHE